MIRNTTNTLKVFAFNHNTAHPQTGDAANITCKVSLNGGARNALADTNPTELEDGYYLFDITAAESNGVTADFFPESSTNNIQVICVEHNRYLLPEGGAATLANQNTIISAISGASVTLVSPVSDIGTLTVYNNRTYGGSAHSAIQFNVSKNYTAASSVELVIYEQANVGNQYVSFPVTVSSATLLTVAGTVNVDDALFGTTGTIQCRYSLFANWGADQETISTGKALIYGQPE